MSEVPLYPISYLGFTVSGFGVRAFLAARRVFVELGGFLGGRGELVRKDPFVRDLRTKSD